MNWPQFKLIGMLEWPSQSPELNQESVAALKNAFLSVPMYSLNIRNVTAKSQAMSVDH